MRKRFALSISLLLSAVLLLSACGQPKPAQPAPQPAPAQPAPAQPAPAQPAPAQPAAKPPIKFGVVTALTGNLASTGQMVAAGVKQAVKEINDKGGIGGAKVELLIEDDQSTPQGALNAFNKLVGEKVVAVQGPTFTPLMMAIAPRIVEAKIPVFTGATGPVVTKKENSGGWIFRLRTNDIEAGAILAEYALKNAKTQKPAMLYANNDYGKGGYDAIKAEFDKAGVKFIATEQFNQGDKDMSAQLGKIKQANPDFVMVYSVPADSGLISVQAAQVGLDGKKIIGSPGFATPDYYALAKETSEGIVTAVDSMAGQDEKTKAWADAVRATSPNIPVSFVSSNSYDAAMLIFGIIAKTGKSDGQTLRDNLYATKGYDGVTGKISFDAEGNGLHQLVIARWEKGKMVPIATIAR